MFKIRVFHDYNITYLRCLDDGFGKETFNFFFYFTVYSFFNFHLLITFLMNNCLAMSRHRAGKIKFRFFSTFSPRKFNKRFSSPTCNAIVICATPRDAQKTISSFKPICFADKTCISTLSSAFSTTFSDRRDVISLMAKPLQHSAFAIIVKNGST